MKCSLVYLVSIQTDIGAAKNMPGYEIYERVRTIIFPTGPITGHSEARFQAQRISQCMTILASLIRQIRESSIDCLFSRTL
jgi:hypothetical protein